MFLIYVAVVLLNRWADIGLTEDDIYALTGGTGAVAIGQGIADMGKEKAKVEINDMARREAKGK